MGADEIEIACVRMVRRRRVAPFRKVRPIKPDAGEVTVFDSLPPLEAMNPALKPVMIAGHDQKDGREGGEQPIAGLKPFHFIEGDGADERGHEQDETPTAESFAGALSVPDECRDSPEQPLELPLAR